MRELNVDEVISVSGGAPLTPEQIVSRLGGSILAATVAAMNGAVIGYNRGGDATGVWGLSLIGQLVGAAGGGIIGGIGGAVGGLLVPFDYVYQHAIDAVKNMMAGGVK